MQLAGHTMDVPKMNIFQAMEFFQKIGYTGMEIRCAEDGHLDPESYTSSAGRQIRKRAQTYQMDIVCLTSYYLDLVSEGKM